MRRRILFKLLDWIIKKMTNKKYDSTESQIVDCCTYIKENLR